MKYRLRIADEAAEALLSIARWYLEKSQSDRVAAEWYDGFVDKLQTLETRVTGTTVEVLAIRHHAQQPLDPDSLGL